MITVNLAWLRSFVITSLSLLLFINPTKAQHNYPLLYEETFESGSTNWAPNIPGNWSLGSDADGHWYELLRAGSSCSPRRPTSISILTPYSVGNFELQVVAKCNTDSTVVWRDICLFFGYQDSVHFYYTHFSAISDDNHNIIAIVDNSDRKKINLEASGRTDPLLNDCQCHTLKIIRSVESGSIEAYFDNEKIMTAVDSTFLYGKIGIGSFDDVASFKTVKLWGELAETNVGRATKRPSGFTLLPNYPNPFNASTTMRFKISNKSNVALNVYDTKGRLYQRLADTTFDAGQHEIKWDVKDSTGHTVSSGVYIVRAQAGGRLQIKKCTMLK